MLSKLYRQLCRSFGSRRQPPAEAKPAAEQAGTAARAQARSAFKQGDLRAARKYFTEISNAAPDDLEAHYYLGRLDEAAADPQAAADHYRTCLAMPVNTGQESELLCRIGLCMEAIGRNEPEKLEACTREALACFANALEIDQHLADAAAGYARVLERTGEKEKASEAIRPFVQQQTDNAAVLQVYSRLCVRKDCHEDAVSRLQQLLAREKGGPSGKNRQILLFSLGRLLDAGGQYDAAFAAYREANDLFPQKAPTFSAQAEKIITAFDAALFSGLPGTGRESERPIFIVGMPRSGTTLVEQILDAHPDVHGAGELKYFNKLHHVLDTALRAHGGYPEGIRYIEQSMLEQSAAEYLELLTTVNAEARFVTDKNNMNFIYLGLIQLLLPKARVIHCQRDPVDTCLSIYFQDFELSHIYSKDLESIGRAYLVYQGLMDHWADVLRLPIMTLDYEKLVTDTESGVRQLLEFCSLPWDERCMQFYNKRRLVDTSSYNQVNRPVYRESVNRARHYDAYLGPLKQLLSAKTG